MSTPLPIIDGHLDLAYLALQGVDLTAPTPDPAKFGVNLPSLAQGGVRVAFATLFTERCHRRAEQPWEYEGDDVEGAHRAGIVQLDLYAKLEERGFVRIVRSVADLEPIDDGGPLRIVLLMEGADPIRDAGELAWWHDRGVRLIGLSWANGSRYAGGNAAPSGLTPAGRELLAAMHERRVTLDLSHLPDRSVDEALEAFPGRVVATHSNCRALLDASERHLRDDQISRIAERRGILGLNLYGRFLVSNGEPRIADALRHLRHLRRLAPGRVAIGSDLDGGFTPSSCAPGLGRPEELPNLLEALRGDGADEPTIRSIAFEAWRDFLRETLPGAATA